MGEYIAGSILIAAVIMIVAELIDRFIGGGDDGKGC